MSAADRDTFFSMIKSVFRELFGAFECLRILENSYIVSLYPVYETPDPESSVLPNM